MTESIKIKFIEKKLTYNKLINVLKEELDSNIFFKVKKVLENNDIEERMKPQKTEDTYYKQISAEIFERLKKEKEKDPEAFNKKYNKKSMLAIKNQIWTKEYKNK
jgi:hypothetical protein